MIIIRNSIKKSSLKNNTARCLVINHWNYFDFDCLLYQLPSLRKFATKFDDFDVFRNYSITTHIALKILQVKLNDPLNDFENYSNGHLILLDCEFEEILDGTLHFQKITEFLPTPLQCFDC